MNSDKKAHATKIKALQDYVRESIPTQSPTQSTLPTANQVSKYQTFITERVHRSQIALADYNPRTMDDEARGKLHANLKTVGLVAALTWNRRTGNLVAGHQRIAELDALEGSQDYYLDLNVVDLDEKTEREQNIFLNNRAAQGDYDVLKVAELFSDKVLELNPAAAGFGALDLQLMFDEAGVGMFSDTEGLAAIDELKAMGAEKSTKRHADRAPGEMPSRAVVGELGLDEREATEETETMSVIVFLNPRERAVFLAAMGCDEHQRYVDGSAVFAKLGIDPSEAWASELG